MAKNIEYGMVDLGLPSGLKWADRNVGSTSPERFGYYFAWGETAPRGENWATEAPYNWSHAPFNNGREKLDEAYFSEHKPEWLDGDVLKPEYDAAHSIMGGSWRMPTSAEMQELLDGTTQSVDELNGVKGMRFTSKANGNSIFIPFCGFRFGFQQYCTRNCCNLWTSSLNEDDVINFWPNYAYFDIYEYSNVGSDDRFYGFSVRGVCL